MAKRRTPNQVPDSRVLAAMSALLGLSLVGPAWSAQRHTVDATTGIETWETTVAGVSVALTQILPDQLRAFYANRGFASGAIEPYAGSCVYMAVMRNDAASGVARFRLADWRVVTAAEQRPPVATTEWIARIEPTQPGAAAMIAFRWAQFPSEHAYQPGGDWNQGMLSMGLAAGARFDLIARWTVHGEPYEAILENVRCARDNP